MPDTEEELLERVLEHERDSHPDGSNDLRIDLEAYVQAREAPLREALADLLEGAEDMRAYVTDYFAEKWGHDAYLARARAALQREEAQP